MRRVSYRRYRPKTRKVRRFKKRVRRVPTRRPHRRTKRFVRRSFRKGATVTQLKSATDNGATRFRSRTGRRAKRVSKKFVHNVNMASHSPVEIRYETGLNFYQDTGSYGQYNTSALFEGPEMQDIIDRAYGSDLMLSRNNNDYTASHWLDKVAVESATLSVTIKSLTTVPQTFEIFECYPRRDFPDDVVFGPLHTLNNSTNSAYTPGMQPTAAADSASRWWDNSQFTTRFKVKNYRTVRVGAGGVLDLKLKVGPRTYKRSTLHNNVGEPELQYLQLRGYTSTLVYRSLGDVVVPTATSALDYATAPGAYTTLEFRDYKFRFMQDNKPIKIVIPDPTKLHPARTATSLMQFINDSTGTKAAAEYAGGT